MSDDPVILEARVPPDDAGLAAAAQANPGSWIYDIDRAYPEDQPVPPEAIRGSWQVGADGKLTGSYARNARYRPIRRGTRELKPYMHAAAESNPDQWIAEIDPRGEELFPDIPPRLIRGWWYVDAGGRISDQFRPNSEYEPPVR